MNLSDEEMRSFAIGALHDFPVLFLGFRSTVGDLMRNGWRIEIQEYDQMMNNEVAYFVNRQMRLGGVISKFSRLNRIHHPIEIKHICALDGLKIHSESPITLATLQPSLIGEQTMRMISMQEYCLADLLEIESKAPEMIVDPADVNQMLEMIIEAQRPKQKELREKMRKSAIRSEAKIVSFCEFKEQVGVK